MQRKSLKEIWNSVMKDSEKEDHVSIWDKTDIDEKIKRHLLLRSLGAGAMITISCAIYLATSSTSKALGAFLFSLGLMSICIAKMKLYTGVCGYLSDPARWKKYPGSFPVEVVLIWLGNLWGAFLTGGLLRITNGDVNYQKLAADLWTNKAGYGPLTLTILGIFCGALMFIAVDNWKTNEDKPVLKELVLIICVVGFIMGGFEHSVADMGYLAISGIRDLKSIITIVFVSIGNLIGANLMFHLSYWYKNKAYEE